jgi:hypothetical protein
MDYFPHLSNVEDGIFLARRFEKGRAVRFMQKGTLLDFEISCTFNSNVRMGEFCYITKASYAGFAAAFEGTWGRVNKL